MSSSTGSDESSIEKSLSTLEEFYCDICSGQCPSLDQEAAHKSLQFFSPSKKLERDEEEFPFNRVITKKDFEVQVEKKTKPSLAEQKKASSDAERERIEESHLSVFRFPADQIRYVTTAEELRGFCRECLAWASTQGEEVKRRVVSFDAEWNPFNPKTDVVQFCFSPSFVTVIHISRIFKASYQLPSEFSSVLKNILLVGVNVRHDVDMLCKTFNLDTDGIRVLELQNLGDGVLGSKPVGNWGLRSLFETLQPGSTISKDLGLTLSRWHKFPLPPESLVYAATDAFAGFSVFHELTARGDVDVGAFVQSLHCAPVQERKVSSSQSFDCDICFVECPTLKDLLEHKLFCQMIESQSEDSSRASSEEKTSICNICLTSFSSQKYLTDHVKSSHRTETENSDIASFMQRIEVIHVADDVVPDLSLVCITCLVQCPSAVDLANHSQLCRLIEYGQ